MNRLHRTILALLVTGFMSCVPAVAPTPTPNPHYHPVGSSQQ
jgi:hypothetical protein